MRITLIGGHRLYTLSYRAGHQHDPKVVHHEVTLETLRARCSLKLVPVVDDMIRALAGKPEGTTITAHNSLAGNRMKPESGVACYLCLARVIPGKPDLHAPEMATLASMVPGRPFVVLAYSSLYHSLRILEGKGYVEENKRIPRADGVYYSFVLRGEPRA